MRTKHTRRQTQADLVDTTLNMDRRQLPDFLNTNIGYKVFVQYEHDDMIANIKEEYAGGHIIEWRDLR